MSSSASIMPKLVAMIYYPNTELQTITNVHLTHFTTNHRPKGDINISAD